MSINYGRFLLYLEISKQNKNNIGSYISTKQVGNWEREDITYLYKHPEGTKEERKAFDTAYSFGERAKMWPGFFGVEEEGKDLDLGIFYHQFR